MSPHDIEATVRSISEEFPAVPPTRAGDFAHPHSEITVCRVAFDAGLVLSRTGRDATVIDLGGGLGLFSTTMAAMGVNSVMVDDHYHLRTDPGWATYWEALQSVWARYGVELVSRDLTVDGLGPSVPKADAVTAFHLVEHLHHSPKPLLQEAVAALEPGGVLVIAVPNAANLRKRITVPLKGTGWSALDTWYEEPVFRGHVREPTVADLRYIAQDLGLGAEIIGRNFLGHAAQTKLRRRAAQALDRPLQRRPSLCSDLYLVGALREDAAT
jgi:SAM-dependent methyltransferase